MVCKMTHTQERRSSIAPESRGIRRNRTFGKFTCFTRSYSTSFCSEDSLSAVLDHASDGTIIRKIGIMAVVEQGGWVRAGDPIVVSEPTVRVPLQVI